MNREQDRLTETDRRLLGEPAAGELARDEGWLTRRRGKGYRRRVRALLVLFEVGGVPSFPDLCQLLAQLARIGDRSAGEGP